MQGQYLKFIDAELMDIGSMLQETPVLWRHYQERALRVTTIADQYGIMRDKDNMGLRTNCLDVIQRYATYDHETMRDHILSTWCERGWHQVLEDDPENVRALSGKYSPLLSYLLSVSPSWVQRQLQRPIYSRHQILFKQFTSQDERPNLP